MGLGREDGRSEAVGEAGAGRTIFLRPRWALVVYYATACGMLSM